MKNILKITLTLLLAGILLIPTAPALALSPNTPISPVDASFWGDNDDDLAGYSVAMVGDVNGDGYDDILIGAYLNDDGGKSAGHSYVFRGKASGWSMDTYISANNGSFIGEGYRDLSGWSVAAAGDVNGDGFNDILIGAPEYSKCGTRCGRSYLIGGHQHSGMWIEDKDIADDSRTTAIFTGEVAYDYSGWDVAGAGDVNGDGYDDILISAVGRDEEAGETYLFLGKDYTVNLQTDVEYFDLSEADASFTGEDDDDLSGYAVSGAGDVNGDGFDDFIIGASDYPDGDEKGKSYLIMGRADAKTAWGMTEDVATIAAASFIGEYGGDKAGWSVSGGGDVNGDGFDDLLIGAPYNYDGYNYDAGQAYLIFSDTSGPTSGTYKNFVKSGDTPQIHYPGANVTVDFSACTSSSGYLTVTEHNNQKPDGVAVNRYWSIEPTGLSAYTYDITFKYTGSDYGHENDGEIAEVGGDESKLQLYKKVGEIWEAVPGTIKAIANQITATGQTGFSDWALGNSDSPIGCSDSDGDGYGVGQSCTGPDCDDSVFSCTTDCITNADGDTLPDCNDPCIDVDGDGYGTGPGCTGPDCDDSVFSCNTDCITNADGDILPDCNDPCIDVDGDGYGTGAGCTGPDCDDSVFSCTTDCITNADGDILPDCNDPCIDGDGDGYGIGAGCTGPDCDDDDAGNFPTNPESCDCADNNCNGQEDEGCPLTFTATVNAADSYYFGCPIDATINCTALTVPGTITVSVHPGESHPLADGDSVQRWFEVDSTASGTFTLTLSYKNGELNGQTESDLCFWRHSGGTWYGPYIGNVNESANTITVEIGNDFSDWVIRDNQSQAPVPEIITIILVGLGLLAIGGFVWYQRRKASIASA